MQDNWMETNQMGSSVPSSSAKPYTMRISRLTIDKLGVKLYDRVSAVVAELIANSYDADTETVTVRVPLSTLLASKDDDGKPVDNGYVIEVEDDGHGMSPDEAIDHYLQVGRDRRKQLAQGSMSRNKKRPVMGRKGIGKLAPFGICQRIEVLSAGGEKTPDGYLVTHFYMDFDDIVQDTDEPATFASGSLDRTFRPNPGTLIRLGRFLPKRVPNAEAFHRQLAARFAFARSDFEILIEDTRDPANNPVRKVQPISIPIYDETRIDLSARPVVTDDGQHLSVEGWLAMAREPYKYEETAGVRLYARNKIVATTRDFEQPTGFTGEFTIRTYLVGEVHADWLDLDDGEDLIRTDRQSILWDSDYGRALRTWGGELIREIGAKTRKPRRKRTHAIFMKKSDFEVKAKARFADPEIVKVALDLAKTIGSFAAEDELDDDAYVADLAEVIFSVAPHRALIEAFQDFNKQVSGGEVTLEKLADLFSKTQIAEMASYSQIAAERVRVIHELEGLIHSVGVDEGEFQKLIANAPWLIEPTWTVVTRNQALKTFKAAFEHYWKQRTGNDVTLAIGYSTKRPDFTLVSVGQMLHIVEIKTSGHSFDDTDFSRLINYIDAFDAFFDDHKELKTEFPRGYRIDLIADGVNLSTPANKHAYGKFVDEEKVVRSTWNDFLTRATNAHASFLDISDQARARLQQQTNGGSNVATAAVAQD